MVSTSIKDVAALAGVSAATVSNVLNHPEVVASDTVARVTLAMQKLDYVRNDAARQLRIGHSQTIGLLTHSSANPFFADLTTAVEDAAAQAGYSVIVGNSNAHEERELGYLRLFEQLRVRGVLLTPAADPADHLRRLRTRGIPTVLLDSRSSDRSFSSLSVDDIAGGELALAHLIETGRTRLAFAGGPLKTRQIGDRLSGARRAAANRPHVTLEVIEVDALTVRHGRLVGQEIASRPPGRRPDGVFAANDLLAIGISQSLAECRVAIPEQIALVGYDDIEFAGASIVPLTSIRQPSGLIGRTGVETLLAEAGRDRPEPCHARFHPELVIRSSSAGKSDSAAVAIQEADLAHR